MDFTVFSPDEMRAHYKQSLDKAEALRVLADCTCSTQREVAAFLGLPVKRRVRRADVDKKRLYAMLDAGMSERAIAKEIGVSRSTVHNLRVEREVKV